jgi:hypothetical protein
LFVLHVVSAFVCFTLFLLLFASRCFCSCFMQLLRASSPQSAQKPMRRHNSNSTIAWSDFPQEISGNFNILFDFSKKNSMFRKKYFHFW